MTGLKGIRVECEFAGGINTASTQEESNAMCISLRSLAFTAIYYFVTSVAGFSLFIFWGKMPMWRRVHVIPMSLFIMTNSVDISEREKTALVL